MGTQVFGGFIIFFFRVTGEKKTLPRVSMGLYAPWSILQIFQDTRKHRLRGLLENRSFLFSFYFISLSHSYESDAVQSAELRSTTAMQKGQA